MMKLILNPALRIESTEAGLLVVDERTARRASWDRLGITRKAFEEAQRVGFAEITGDAAQVLMSAGVLVTDRPAGSHDDRMYGYFSARTSDPAGALARLGESHVLLLGVGGTGSIALQHLVGAGVRQFTLVDVDQVELSNFNRQYIWDLSDLRRPKVKVGADYVLTRVPSSRVDTLQLRILPENIDGILASTHPDLVVCAIDTPPGIQAVVHAASDRASIAAVAGAVGNLRGHWGPLICPDDGPCWACWEESLHQRQAASHDGQEPAPWSFGPTNSLIGDQVARAAIHYLSGARELNPAGVRTAIDFDTFETWRHALTATCAHRS